MAKGEKDFWNGLLAAAGMGAGMFVEGLARARIESDLHGQVVAITGGSRGLGLLLAREFGRQGCKVSICARDETELERAHRDLQTRGIESLPVRCDIRDKKQVELFVAETTRHFGLIDILVNNAGIIQVGPVQSMTLPDFEDAMNTMFWGTVYPTMAVLPQMLDRRAGRIVNITSIGGKVSAPHLLPYTSAKFAAVGFSQGLTAELAKYGIAVTTIVPGLMRTGSHLNGSFKGRRQWEFLWFSLGASLPLISMDAERAARQIVRATKRREPERILGFPAAAAARFHGVFPGLTAALLGGANRFLPSPPPVDNRSQTLGFEADRQLHSRLLDMATAMGRNAAERFNQISGLRSPR